jgi:hypothetical protein
VNTTLTNLNLWDNELGYFQMYNFCTMDFL